MSPLSDQRRFLPAANTRRISRPSRAPGCASSQALVFLRRLSTQIRLLPENSACSFAATLCTSGPSDMPNQVQVRCRRLVRLLADDRGLDFHRLIVVLEV